MLTNKLRAIVSAAAGKDKTRLDKAVKVFCSNPSIIRPLVCPNSVLSESDLDREIGALNLPEGYAERFKTAYLTEVEHNNKPGVELTVHGEATPAQARASIGKAMEDRYVYVSVR